MACSPGYVPFMFERYYLGGWVFNTHLSYKSHLKTVLKVQRRERYLDRQVIP